MKITTWNLNGIRAVWSHVMPYCLQSTYAEIYCFQETKLQKPDANLSIPDYWSFFSCAYDMHSYSGTAVYTKIRPLRLSYSMSTEASAFIEITKPGIGAQLSLMHKGPQNEWEGRIMTMDFSNFFLVNAYFPNPLRNKKRLDFRKKWDDEFYPYIEELNRIKPTIVCGDFNLIARKIDSHTQVQKSMVEHVALMSRERSYFFHATGSHFVDAYRVVRPKETDCYTWWSNRLNFRNENKGARLDYFLVPKQMKGDIQDCMNIYQVHGSDHCPLRLTIEIPFVKHGQRLTMKARKSIEKAKKGEIYQDMDLAIVWMSINWDAAEKIVYEMQVKISDAAKGQNDNRVRQLENELMDSIYAKLLAVRHVADSAPGVDHVEWRTGTDKMKAALSLNRKGYKSYPYRAFKMKSRYGKERSFGVATHYDRAMQSLMAMALDPVAEARGDEHSFAFRKGRCALDAAEYLRKYLQEGCGGLPPCEWIVKIDVRQFYASISHEWVTKHIPMNPKLLEEVLEQGYVLGGELFPPKNTGIVAGMELSPIIGNMVMDHLQNFIYSHLERKGFVDYDNGRMIRYADDVIFLARTRGDAFRILERAEIFLKERGLSLHQDKTEVCYVKEGFTYMKRWYTKKDSVILIQPTQLAVDVFKRNLEECVHDPEITQEELIPLLNRKLVGWANYHRIEDCDDAYRDIDAFLRVELMKRCERLHPKQSVGTIKRKYFFPDEKGRWTYCLPHDQTKRVIYLSDIRPAVHKMIPVHYNPYDPDSPSLKEIQKQRSIDNVTGVYKPIMERQGGRCVICGQPILPDQEKKLAQYRLGKDKTLYDAYVHARCYTGEIEEVMSEELPISSYQAAYELKDVELNRTGKRMSFYPLIEFFRSLQEDSVTLSFDQIKEMVGGLPPRAKYKSYWLSEGDGKASSVWLENGFAVSELDLDGEKVTFKRVRTRYSRIKIPDWVYRNTLPDGVCDEVEKYFKYVEKKYGLK